MLKRRRHIAATEAERVAEDEQKCQVAMEREKWLIERARAVEVDPELLLPPPTSRAGRQSADSGLGWMGDETDLEQESEQYSQAEDEGIGDPHVGAPETKGLQLMSEQGEVLDDSTLVFGLLQLPTIFDIHISSYRSHCLPLARRTLPANALFLYARFAHYRCNETWLEELIEGAVERIEQGVYVSSSLSATSSGKANDTTGQC